MLFNIYIDRTLYLSTQNHARAFSFFKKHRRKNNVRMEFVQALAVASLAK
jgi:hypothetical protein